MLFLAELGFRQFDDGEPSKLILAVILSKYLEPILHVFID
jgi:hypothetical protein